MLTSPILKQINILSPYMMYSGGQSITSLLFLPRMHSLSLMRIHQTNLGNWIIFFHKCQRQEAPPPQKADILFWIKDDKRDN